MTADLLRGQVWIDLFPEELDQLGLHIIEEIRYIEDDKLLAQIYVGKLLSDERPVHVLHNKDHVSPVQKLSSDLVGGSGGDAGGLYPVHRVCTVDGLGRAASHPVYRADEEEIHLIFLWPKL